ncbi:hypothetical protein [Flavobacterium ajazii]|uniref:hypothetical protein n=1 Tax=Flavobacterium ajazii TaxID=2692318 RepID=UPI0013D2365D|nr:hypothetical protein [Flavobacterium ajazii]
MKKLVMLTVFLLGTTVMVNAQTTPVQATTSKEVKTVKHDKKRHKKAKTKAETDVAKPEAAKVQK